MRRAPGPATAILDFTDGLLLFIELDQVALSSTNLADFAGPFLKPDTELFGLQRR